MLSYAILFLIVALVAAAFGFGGIAGTAVGFAQTIFAVAIVLFVLSLLGNFLGWRAPRLF